MFALPNVSAREPIEGSLIALTSLPDGRLTELAKKHASFKQYLNRFTTEFGNKITPAIILLREDAPNTSRTVDAIAAFRDCIAMSCVPISWARAIRYHNNFGILYSNSLAVYPWMVDKNFEHLVTHTMSMLGLHDVNKLHAQSSPAMSHRDLSHGLLDRTLLDALLHRWTQCFCNTPDAKDVALFRSLNMANAAAMMPAGADATMYDLGRSVSLWVSAFEILTPSRRQGYKSVYELLKSAAWELSANKEAKYEAHGYKDTKVLEPLPAWTYGEIYQARNDFLHGNPLDPSRLRVKTSGRTLFHYTSLLYRMALTAYLDLRWKQPIPPMEDTQEFAKSVASSLAFSSHQRDIESALATVLTPLPEDGEY
jgi:hypothetical protein